MCLKHINLCYIKELWPRLIAKMYTYGGVCLCFKVFAR